jgi:hypothetical protein
MMRFIITTTGMRRVHKNLGSGKKGPHRTPQRKTQKNAPAARARGGRPRTGVSDRARGSAPSGRASKKRPFLGDRIGLFCCLFGRLLIGDVCWCFCILNAALPLASSSKATQRQTQQNWQTTPLHPPLASPV